MTHSLEIIKFLDRKISLVLFDNLQDVVQLLDFYDEVEAAHEVAGIEIEIDYVKSRIVSYFGTWAKSQKFGSWDEFKYELFNAIVPFRINLKNWVLTNVNTLKRDIDNGYSSAFLSVAKFQVVMEKIYNIIKKFEEINYPGIEAREHTQELVKKLSADRNKFGKLKMMPEEDMSEEQQDAILEDLSENSEATKIWNEYKEIVAQFLNESCELFNAGNRENMVVFGKLSKKILKLL